MTHTGSIPLCAFFLCCLLCIVSAARFRDIPCASVSAVHGGGYSFTVDISVQRVRALRCVLTIEVTHIPARGVRRGIRAATTCLADGLGCIELTPPVQIVVDIDLPTYERTVIEVPILSQFDDNARTVPFMHMAMQVTETADSIDRAKLPHASWVPRLTGFTFGAENRHGLHQLASVAREKLITIFSPRSKYVAEIDESISPRVVLSDASMLPSVAPRHMMQLVYAGGRSFEFILDTVEHLFPWVNDTHHVPSSLRVVIPHFNELNLRNCKAINHIDRMLQNNKTILEIIQAINATSEAYDFFNAPLEVLIDGLSLDLYNMTTLKPFFFHSPVMRTRGSPMGLGLLSAAEWALILGSTLSSWSSVGCQGSAQCAVTGITVGKHNHQLGRSIPYHVSASQPSCTVLRPQKSAAEVAHVRIGVVVSSAGVSHASVNNRITIQSQSGLVDLQASDDVTGLLVRVVTDEDSVPGFLQEPAHHMYMLNCFSKRGEEAAELVTENPYIRADGETAMTLLEHQRGVLVLPNARTDFHLGSGCGAMNFGMAYWRHIANRMQDAAFSIGKSLVDLAPGHGHAGSHHEVSFGDIHNAFISGGHSCIPSGGCEDYFPAALFQDELKWLRSKGALPPRFPPFNPNAPGLRAALENNRAFAKTPLERDNYAIKDMIPNINKPVPKAKAGCGTPGGEPMTMAGGFWQTNRKNIWVASNRHGTPEGRTLYIEDTHQRLKNKITHGVSFLAQTELKIAHFPHRDVSSNDTGCVYLPASTLTSDPLIACNINSPRVAGTAYADIELGLLETHRELILVVECVGLAFCPSWLANMSVITDAETGVIIPANISTAKDGSIYPLLPTLKHYVERLLPNHTIGEVVNSTGFGELPDFPSAGPTLGEHLIFRFNQTVPKRRYAWEAQGSDRLSTLLGNYFYREYAAQLYSGSLHQAISEVAKFDCHGTDKCKPRPFIQPQCIPIPLVISDPGFNKSQSPPRPDCGFFEVKCQYDNRQMQFLFVMEVIVPVVIFTSIWFFNIHRPQQKMIADRASAKQRARE